MTGLVLLVTVTVLYLGYNLLIKDSASQIPEATTTTIAATICLQVAALATSIVFASIAMVRGGQVPQMTWGAYWWTAAAGLCVGVAEIAYFYLFSGIGTGKPMAANMVIPAVVSGNIVITVVATYFVFGETPALTQLTGVACIILGLLLLYLGKGHALA